LFPFRGKIYADGGYQGGKSQAAVKRVINQINVKIVKRADAVKSKASWCFQNAGLSSGR
jgi:hypothetical protein